MAMGHPIYKNAWLEPLKQDAADLPFIGALLRTAAGTALCIRRMLAPVLGAASAEDAAEWHAGRGPLWASWHHNLLVPAARDCGQLLLHLSTAWLDAVEKTGRQVEAARAYSTLAAPVLAAIVDSSEVSLLCAFPHTCAPSRSCGRKLAARCWF